MDWEAAIKTNRQALKRVLLALVAMAGLAEGQRTHLPRRLHRAVLRLLRPAESAARRLVIVAARGIVGALPPDQVRGGLPLRAPKPERRPAILRNGIGTGIVLRQAQGPHRRTAARKRERLSLPLFDALSPPARNAIRGRTAASGVPRLSAPGFTSRLPVPVRRPPMPDDPIGTARLAMRLQAIGRVLDDLPAEARRFARWRARRAALDARDEARIAAARDFRPGPPRRFRRVSPLRPGRPPGSCRKSSHAVHEALADLHGLAIWALERPDTS